MREWGLGCRSVAFLNLNAAFKTAMQPTAGPLLHADEMAREVAAGRAFPEGQGWMEAPITFPPSFKFVVRAAAYKKGFGAFRFLVRVKSLRACSWVWRQLA